VCSGELRADVETDCTHNAIASLEILFLVYADTFDAP
jgi:hypothetical protein